MSKIKARKAAGVVIHTVPLSLAQQSVVARWAVKTAMVQDAIYTRKRELFYTESERLAVRFNRGLPVYTVIWLGRSSLRTLTCDGTDFVVDINDGNSIVETATGSVSTFVVGPSYFRLPQFMPPRNIQADRSM